MSAVERRAHFIGICGAGMSAAALLLRESGWRLTGSDDGCYPPISELLQRENLPCTTPHAAANIPTPVDLIVIGKHAKLVPELNTEVARAFELQKAGLAEVASFPEVIGRLVADTENLVVAGSFGKSSITAALTWLLREGGADPSWLIGAAPIGLGSNAHRGKGACFVLEGDEYPSSNWDPRPKFLHYRASAALLTSCEHDHYNQFPTLEDYLAPFRALVRALPAAGLLAACADGEGVAEVASLAPCRVVTYSAYPDRGADWHAADIRFEADGVSFSLAHHGRTVCALRSQLLGEHTVQNLVGAAALLLELELITPEAVAAAIPSFPGLRRRLEPKAPNSSLPIFEDLASSRPKAAAAIAAVRSRYPDRRLIALFQPHTFSFRSRRALDWYPGLFAGVDRALIFSPPDLPGLDEDQELSGEEIVSAIRAGNSCPVAASPDADQTIAALESLLCPDDVLLIMTSGGMGGVIPRIVELAEARFPRKSV